jgi:lysophospholipase L1-like esterase
MPDFLKKKNTELKRTIVCIGDSLTQGHLTDPKETYPARLHGLLHKQFNVINLGIGGTTVLRDPHAPGSAAWKWFPHWDVVHQSLGNAKHSEEEHPEWWMREMEEVGSMGRPQWEISFDVAIVQFGTNDVKLRDWNVPKYQSDYIRMIRELMQRHPQATFIVSVPPPVMEWSAVPADVVAKSLPDAIRDLAREVGLKSEPVDMQVAFGKERLLELLRDDGYHPSAAGYVLMSEAAATAVRGALSLPP